MIAENHPQNPLPGPSDVDHVVVPTGPGIKEGRLKSAFLRLISRKEDYVAEESEDSRRTAQPA